MGFRFDTVGKNKFAAGYAGIPITRVILLAMAIAGGLAGLAGAMEVTGTMHHFEPAIGGTLGFDGITIALLARSNPIWTIPAAFLVGILRTGAAGLQFATGIAPEIVDLLLALILLLVSIPVLGKWIFRSRADKVEAAATSWGN
jgi:simple sugar transport system permease protein